MEAVITWAAFIFSHTPTAGAYTQLRNPYKNLTAGKAKRPDFGIFIPRIKTHAMFRHSLSWPFILICCSIVACQESTTENVKYLEPETDMVVMMDLVALAKKAEIRDISDLPFPIDSLPKNSLLDKFLATALRNPDAIGLNLLENPTFSFSLDDGADNSEELSGSLILLGLSDATRLEEFLNQEVWEEHSGIERKRLADHTVLYDPVSGNTIAYSDKALLLSIETGEQGRNYLEQAILLPTKEGLAQSSSFQSFLQERGEVSFWYQPELKENQTMPSWLQTPHGSELPTLAFHLGFEPGEVQLRTGSSALELHLFQEKGADQLYRFLPEELPLRAALNMDWGWISDFFHLDSIAQSPETEVGLALFIDQVSELGGPVVVGMSLDPTLGNLQEVIMAVDLGASRILDEYLPIFLKSTGATDHGWCHELNLQGRDLFLTSHERILLVSTRMNLLESSLKKSSTRIFDTTAPILAQVNFGPQFQDLVEVRFNPLEVQSLPWTKLTPYLQALEVKGDNNTCEFVFKLRDTEGNSLHTLLKAIIEMAREERTPLE